MNLYFKIGVLIHAAWAMSQLDLDRTHQYTHYAAAAYCPGTDFECKSCTGVDGRYVNTLNSELLDTSGYIAVDESDKRIVLAFRGTRDIENDITDLSFLLTAMLGTPFGALVHVGFKAAMESLAPTFLPSIKELVSRHEYADYSVAVVGHSLGGAIASLATVKLHYSLGMAWEKMELYTYGQPRTGNVVFAKWLSQQPLGSSRVVHRNDVIPHLAFGLLGSYVHHQNEVWLREEAVVLCNPGVLEDPNCSYSIPIAQLSLADHLVYFNITLGIYGC
ncbi:hypothetical protein DSO57_1020559 [Entomophthora muscae]|uniref:Uncharacterized protein n=1 Tax=Entomophthora muscae TaxID=34485 RepID=A0ACC2T411_9FUNG|nr:hypothetical protein DSO57_1020559 [Entomophthora muscae]